MDENLLMYCGLYCGDCIRYKSKFSDLARELKKILGEVKFDQYAKVKGRYLKELQGYERFSQVLNAVIELQCVHHCRHPKGGDISFFCEIRDCCTKKNFRGCWECNEMENCKKFEFLEPFHGKNPKKNLEKIRRLGLKEAVRLREKCYPWQE